MSRRYDHVKRVLDLTIALLAIVVLSPVLLLVAIIIARTLGGPVLFRQARPGRRGKPFVLVKFRTMRAVDPACGLVTDGDRLTPLGRFLRATSLDELPTLFNVLCGQMSLVGPRPLLVEYLPIYTPEQARRHEVRPGITGLAQVRGRNALSWEAKFGYDVHYVDHRSLLLDLHIFARTIGSVLGRQGISADGHVSMPAFAGSPAPAQASSFATADRATNT